MKAKILLDQAEALKQGIDAPREGFVNFNPMDLTVEQREELAMHDFSDDAWSASHGYTGEFKVAAVTADLETLKAILNAHISYKNAEKAKEQNAIDTAAQKVLAWLDEPIDVVVPPYVRRHLDNFPADLVSRYNKKLERHNAYVADKKRKEEAEREEQRRLKAEKKAAIIKEWLATHGDDNMRERFDAGLLSEKESTDAIRDWLFEPIQLPEYQYIELSDFCECYEQDDDSLDCETLTPTAVDAHDWTKIKEARTAYSEFTWSFVLHKCSCSRCDESMTRMALKAEKKFGVWTFSREFAC